MYELASELLASIAGPSSDSPVGLHKLGNERNNKLSVVLGYQDTFTPPVYIPP